MKPPTLRLAEYETWAGRIHDTVHASIDASRDRYGGRVLEELGFKGDGHRRSLITSVLTDSAKAAVARRLHNEGFAWEYRLSGDDGADALRVGEFLTWLSGNGVEAARMAFWDPDDNTAADVFAVRGAPLPGGWSFRAGTAETVLGHVVVEAAPTPTAGKPALGDRNWHLYRSATDLVRPEGDGETHRVSLVNGQLVFHDHPKTASAAAADAFHALAGTCCACDEFLKDWKNRRAGDARVYGYDHGERLMFASRDCAKVTERRRDERDNTPVDALTVPLLERAAERSVRSAEEALTRTAYRAVQHTLQEQRNDRWARPADRLFRWGVTVNAADGDPSLDCAGKGTTFTVQVKPTWWATVGKVAAVIDGFLVLDIVETDDDGLPSVVVAGRQGAGHTAYTCTAKVRHTASGASLRWQ